MKTVATSALKVALLFDIYQAKHFPNRRLHNNGQIYFNYGTKAAFWRQPTHIHTHTPWSQWMREKRNFHVNWKWAAIACDSCIYSFFVFSEIDALFFVKCIYFFFIINLLSLCETFDWWRLHFSVVLQWDSCPHPFLGFYAQHFQLFPLILCMMFI